VYVVLKKETSVSEVLAAYIITTLMVVAVSTSKTSVNFYETTWSNVPEDYYLHIRCHENLKSNLQDFSLNLLCVL
jgi:hypothetical protein